MTINKEKVHIVLTGGTMDSFYDGTRDTAVPNKSSVIPKYLDSLNLYQDFEFTEICMKDSRDLTSDDRSKILETIDNSEHKRVIITHGTYTTPDTARFLKANLKNKDKVIVITASFIPLIGFSPSDAPFNLAYAISKTQDLSPGIYVAMNGRLFDPNEVIKEIREGKFSSIQ